MHNHNLTTLHWCLQVTDERWNSPANVRTIHLANDGHCIARVQLAQDRARVCSAGAGAVPDTISSDGTALAAAGEVGDRGGDGEGEGEEGNEGVDELHVGNLSWANSG